MMGASREERPRHAPRGGGRGRLCTVIFLLGFLLVVSGQRFRPNGDVERALSSLQTQLEGLIRNFNRGWRGDLKSLDGALARLEEAIAHNAEHRVHRRSVPALELEAKNEALFGTIPVLPPESKVDGRWIFPTVRFEVVPRHLFLYDLKFRADHTVRLRKATLFFRDGSSLVHDTWWSMEDGNGKAFPKKEYLPVMGTVALGEARRARALAAIEIVGSAQDGGFEAVLDFTFTVPDPMSRPYRQAEILMAQIKRNWAVDEVDAARLNWCMADLVRLARALEVAFRPRAVAR